MAEPGVGSALTGLLEQLAQTRASIDTMGPGAPRLGAKLDVPLGQDQTLGVSGGFQKRDAMSPAEWEAMLRYTRRF